MCMIELFAKRKQTLIICSAGYITHIPLYTHTHIMCSHQTLLPIILSHRRLRIRHCVCSLSNDGSVFYSQLLPPSHLHLVCHTFFPPSLHHLQHSRFLSCLFCFYLNSLLFFLFTIPPPCLPSTFSHLFSLFLTSLIRFLHHTGMPCPGAIDRSAPVPYWHRIFEGHG